MGCGAAQGSAVGGGAMGGHFCRGAVLCAVGGGVVGVEVWTK